MEEQDEKGGKSDLQGLFDESVVGKDCQRTAVDGVEI